MPAEVITMDDHNSDQGDYKSALERLRGMFDEPPATRQWGNPLEKIEELLTCPICLERYKTPKLLPCQHTFCMEPCLDGLVDSVRRVVKCPECRAEHPMPYEGPKAFQTNYTLMGFLEVHLQASEENAEELESYIRRYNLERCKICDEKAEVVLCLHCDKKVCLECKANHIEMIKRDLGRLMSQVKRLSNRITEASDSLSKGMDSLAFNCDTVKEEIKDFIRRYLKDLKKKEERLLTDMETFRTVETRMMKSLRDSLELESSNINEACARVEACLKGEREATDEDLVKFKVMFTEGLDYLRTFSPDADDLCMKKIRFSMGQDPNSVTHAIQQFGELNVCTAQFSGKFQQLEALYVPRIFNITLESDQSIKSKKRQWDINDTSTWNQASNGESSSSSSSGRRYGVGQSVGGNRQQDEDHRSLRYRRRQQLEEEAWKRLRGDPTNSPSGRRSPRNGGIGDDLDDTQYARQHIENSPFGKVQHMSTSMTESFTNQQSQANTLKVENAKQKADNSPNQQQQQQKSHLPRPAAAAASGGVSKQTSPKIVQHQASSEDKSLNEKVDNIRREHEQNRYKAPQFQTSPQNSSAKTAGQTAQTPNSAEKPKSGNDNATAAVKQQIKIRAVSAKIQPPQQQKPKENAVISTNANTKNEESEEEEEEEDEEPPANQGVGSPITIEEPVANIPIKHYPPSPRSRRSCGPDFAELAGNSTAAQNPTAEHAVRKPDSSKTDGAPLDWKKYLIPHPTKSSEPPKFGKFSMGSSPSTNINGGSGDTSGASGMAGTLQSFMDRRSSSRDSESESSWADKRRRFVRSKTNPELMGALSHSSLNDLAEAYARGTGTTRKPEASDNRRRFGMHRRDNGDGSQDAEPAPEPSAASYRANQEQRRNRYRRKAEKSHTGGLGIVPSDNGDSRCEININNGENGNRYFRVFTNPRVDYLNKSRVRRKFGNKGAAEAQFNWPRGLAIIPMTEEIAVCDSSNHRVQIFDKRGQFLRTFGGYGSNKGEFDCLAGIAVNKYKQFVVTDRYNHRVQIFDSTGRFLREFGAHGQTNGRFNNPWGVVVDNQGFIYVCDKDNHRVQIFQADGNFVGKFGGIGNREGQFQNPHFIAVNRQNQLIVSDSSNHRIQVFDHNGHFQFTFGSEGFHEGQFKHPRGITVDDQGFIIVADSGNNRIQVFYPDGRFYAEFGVWGSGEGQLKGVEGVVVSTDGHIIVSDRENHRIQVF